MHTLESTGGRDARAARYEATLRAIEAAGPRARPAVDVEAHIKAFITDALGTNHSKTELLYGVGELLLMARDFARIARSGTVSQKDWVGLLADSSEPAKRYGPPFNISWADFLDEPIIAFMIFAIQESFLRVTENFERALAGAAEKSFEDRGLDLMMERTNLMPGKFEMPRFDRDPPTTRTFREPAAARAESGRDHGIYRDGALDRMAADARDMSRAGDFPRGESTGRTA